MNAFKQEFVVVSGKPAVSGIREHGQVLNTTAGAHEVIITASRSSYAGYGINSTVEGIKGWQDTNTNDDLIAAFKNAGAGSKVTFLLDQANRVTNIEVDGRDVKFDPNRIDVEVRIPGQANGFWNPG